MCEFEIVFRYFDLCYQVVTYRRQLLILPVLLFHLKKWYQPLQISILMIANKEIIVKT